MSNHYTDNLLRELYVDEPKTHDELKNHPNITNAIKTCVQFLKPTHKELIQLRYRDGLTYNECATATNITPTQVRQRINEAHKQIKRKIIHTLDYTEPTDVLDLELNMLHLTPNARFALSTNNIKTVRDVIDKSLLDLLSLPRMDKVVLKVLLEALENQNINIHLTTTSEVK